MNSNGIDLIDSISQICKQTLTNYYESKTEDGM